MVQESDCLLVAVWLPSIPDVAVVGKKLRVPAIELEVDTLVFRGRMLSSNVVFKCRVQGGAPRPPCSLVCESDPHTVPYEDKYSGGRSKAQGLYKCLYYKALRGQNGLLSRYSGCRL